MLVMFSVMAEDYAPEELESLVLSVAAGNREALAQLYSRTRAAVYGLALSYLRSGCDAEDVTQDTFVRVWEAAPGYRPQGSPMAWLLTIAKNLSLMKLRERGKVLDMPQESWDTLAIESPAVTPEDRQVLSAALSILSGEERKVILLHAVTGLKHREIAQLLGMPLPTVLSKYHRGLRKLRTKLEGDDCT